MANWEEPGDPDGSRWTATRYIVANLDYAGAEQDVTPGAPITLAGAAGRRQRWTAGPGEGAGEIAERMTFGPDIPYDYEGESAGRIAEIKHNAEDRRQRHAARKP